MNEPTTYKGLCIGGPADGKIITSTVPEFTYMAYNPDGKRNTYLYVAISFGGEKFGFWSPGVIDPDWIVSELVKRYATR